LYWLLVIIVSPVTSGCPQVAARRCQILLQLIIAVLHVARGQEDAPQNLAATRPMVFAHTNRFRTEDPHYFSDTGFQ
jgi:hypothetical protein